VKHIPVKQSTKKTWGLLHSRA